MDFNFTEAESLFRRRLRSWLSEKLPKCWNETAFEPEDEDERARFRLDWERRLFEGGWTGLDWPTEYGGQGATLVERAIFAEEMARFGAPEGLNIIGRNLTGPTLIHHGSEQQRKRFLPKILSAEEVWCQGFSEPSAGSDLAAVKCKASREGDYFVVNGQKTWTSFAQYADWCFLLVRTDPDAPKHKGLSFLLVDMGSEGITRRALRQVSGESEFNELFFDDVRVPVENIVGELNGGWRIAMTTLTYERGPEDALARQVGFRKDLEHLLAKVSESASHGEKLIEKSMVRQKIGKALVDLEVMRLNCLRSFSRSIKGQERGSEASMIKLYWSHVAQDMYEMALDILGPIGAVNKGRACGTAGSIGSPYGNKYLTSRAFTVYSGSSEIQRNIIGERVLNLPR